MENTRKSKALKNAIVTIAFLAMFGVQSGNVDNFGIAETYATGCCGGGPKGVTALSGESDPDSNDIGLGSLGPLNAAIREAARTISMAGPAIREAREGIEFLQGVRVGLNSVTDLTALQRQARKNVVDELIEEQRASISAIRGGFEETAAVLAELLAAVRINEPAKILQDQEDRIGQINLGLSLFRSMMRGGF